MARRNLAPSGSQSKCTIWVNQADASSAETLAAFNYIPEVRENEVPEVIFCLL